MANTTTALGPLEAAAITLQLFEAERAGINAALAQRYLTGFGFALLVYDHIITFEREVALVWRAKASPSKFLFLLNRYIVPCAMIPVLWEESGFVGNLLTDRTCQQISIMNFVLGITSVALANSMILMRVVALWQHRRLVALILTGTYIVSYGAVLSLMIAVIPRVLPGIMYNPIVGMCVNTITTPLLLCTWAAAMVFEVTIFAATCVNAIDRPRDANTPLLRMLRRDGITFFALITCCRIVNLVLAATGDPRFVFVAVYFIWNMVTLLVSRMLLRLRALDKDTISLPALKLTASRLDVPQSPYRRSFAPTASRLSNLNEGWEMKSHTSSHGEVQVGRIELVVADR